MSGFAVEEGKIAVFVPIGNNDLFAYLRDKIDVRRKWDAARRAFVFPDSKAVREKLGIDADGKSAGEIEPDATAGYASPAAAPAVAVPRRRDRKSDAATNVDFSLSAVPWPGEFPPFEHQVDGRRLLLTHDEFLLAWEMGLGKSAVVSAALAYDRTGPTLIACPRVVLNVWPRELKTHGGLHCVVVEGTPSERRDLIRRLGDRSIAVATYEIIIRDLAELERIQWETIVADEIHRAKNSTSQTSKALRRLADGDKGRAANRAGARKPARRRWALSGTPAPNGPLDWFGPLLFLGEDHAGTPYKTVFENRYAVYAKKPVFAGIKQVLDWKDLGELNDRVSKVCNRRKKADCLDLPPKVYTTIPVDLGKKARKVYDELRKESLARLESGSEIKAENILTEILRLLQVVGGYVGVDHPDGTRSVEYVGDNAKLDALLDLLEDVEGKAIIFGHFKAEIEAAANALGDAAVVHTGETKDQDRKDRIARFRSDPSCRFLCATTPSMREGVTLVEAKTVVYLSRGYNLVDWLQSQDRAHRIGQTELVRIITLVGRRTLDEKIALALDKKENLQERMMTVPREIAEIADDAERSARAQAWIKGQARGLFE